MAWIAAWLFVLVSREFRIVTTHVNMDGKIAGGQYASILNYPHAAHLAINCQRIKHEEDDKKNSMVWSCGSSILNQHLVLTAAHCLYKCSPSSGFISITVGSENKWTVSHLAEDYLVHWDYDERNMKNDLALVKIQKQLRFGNKIKRVIVMQRQPQVQLASISGWGLVNEIKKTTTDWLKETQQYVPKHEECLKLFPHMPDGMFCATPVDDGQLGFPLPYDSGSGLIAKHNVLIGVVSYKKHYHFYQNGTVYTNTSHFYDWIITASRKLHCRRDVLSRILFYLGYLDEFTTT